MRERRGRAVLNIRRHRAGMSCSSRGRAMRWGPKTHCNGLTWVRHQRDVGAWPFQELSREHQVLGRGRTKAIARVRQEVDTSVQCNLVAPAECGQAHRAGATRPSGGRAMYVPSNKTENLTERGISLTKTTTIIIIAEYGQPYRRCKTEQEDYSGDNGAHAAAVMAWQQQGFTGNSLLFLL
ncbi:hypothetical protein PIB30_027999 [Stylosanthes scabra]|uniref:Uncharacterized protein n=1 Tax=Stylosanthes scabra TaxID=79078 RepID=A0ABU6XA17_9FABA|nr:hypothetical protein [Stylosanthes scabra]